MKFLPKFAYHEAGHAALAHLLGYRVHSILSEPKKGKFTATTQVQEPITENHRYMILTAGAAAMVIKNQDWLQENETSVYPDFKELRHLPHSQIDSIYCHAEQLLTANWQKVESLAACLIGHRRLSGIRLQKILSKDGEL